MTRKNRAIVIGGQHCHPILAGVADGQQESCFSLGCLATLSPWLIPYTQRVRDQLRSTPTNPDMSISIWINLGPAMGGCPAPPQRRYPEHHPPPPRCGALAATVISTSFARLVGEALRRLVCVVPHGLS
jgi:hypothetical protein